MRTAKKKTGRPRIHGDDARRITLLVEAVEYDRLAAFKRHRSAPENRDVSFARVLLARSRIESVQKLAEDETVNADEKQWEVFISHASEDKADVAKPIADALTAKGVRVWFDKTELRIGNSLRRKIDEGLAKSSFGVVILSTFFFAKRWPQKELDGLVARAEDGIILPVWHGLTEMDVAKYSPTLADLVAARTSDGLHEVVRQILEAVRPGEGAESGDAASTVKGHLDVTFDSATVSGSATVSPTDTTNRALHAEQRMATFEAWKLLQIALGRAADLASPVQYRPDFRFELSDEAAGKEVSRRHRFPGKPSQHAWLRSSVLRGEHVSSRESRTGGDTRKQTATTLRSRTS